MAKGNDQCAHGDTFDVITHQSGRPHRGEEIATDMHPAQPWRAGERRRGEHPKCARAGDRLECIETTGGDEQSIDRLECETEIGESGEFPRRDDHVPRRFHLDAERTDEHQSIERNAEVEDPTR